MDESMITGESRPVRRSVVAGTVSSDRAISARVEAVGDDTALAGTRRLVADAQASSSRTQVLADRAAAARFYLAVGERSPPSLAWAAVGDPAEGIVRTVTVLVIACSRALRLRSFDVGGVGASSGRDRRPPLRSDTDRVRSVPRGPWSRVGSTRPG